MKRAPIQIHLPEGLWPPTWPMGLTMLRLLLLPLFIWLLLIDARASDTPHPHRWWALAVFAVMAITDKLDGYLARKLHQTTRLGTILDPVADKILVACSVILMSFEWVVPQPYTIPAGVVVMVYGKDLIIAIGTVALLAVVGKVSIVARPLGKTSTFLQLSLVIGTLLAPDLRQVAPVLCVRLLGTLWWAVSILAAASCTDYLWQGIRQFRSARSQAAQTPHVEK